MTKYLIIVAGGQGLRMGGSIPKQFMELQGIPILMRTLNRFTDLYPEIKINIGINPSYKDYWQQLCKKHDFLNEHLLIDGGNHRFDTVKNCLQHLKPDGIVAIHDAVRPFVSKNVISQCFNMAEKKGNAIPVTGIKESIRRISRNNSESVPREFYKIVQTPQVFQTKLIIEAYEKTNLGEDFTDDASVLEQFGQKINLVDGNPENIKITTREDLIWAKAYLDN